MGGEKILVVEADEEFAEVVFYNLRREGFEVTAAATGHGGLRAVRAASPDLVLLDVALPDADGLEICRRIRADAPTADIPVIILSESQEEDDLVRGFGAGADDYVRRPFGPRELVARVRAVLRRRVGREVGRASERVVRGPLIVDSTQHHVSVDGAEVRLTATEFRLLHALAREPDRAFSRDELVRRAIGEHARVDPRNVDVHVRSVRRKLGAERRWIESVRGVGYRFCAT